MLCYLQLYTSAPDPVKLHLVAMNFDTCVLDILLADLSLTTASISSDSSTTDRFVVMSSGDWIILRCTWYLTSKLFESLSLRLGNKQGGEAT